MDKAVLLDTSFLITLSKKDRVRHPIARRYFEYFLENEMPMILSAIVISEFCMRQELSTLPLQQLIVQPFNHDDAVQAARLDFKSIANSGSRDALKDDFKLLGQAKARGYGYLITEDAETMFEYCEAIRKRGDIRTRPIKLQTAFSREHFEPNGQKDFPETLISPTPS